MWWLTGIMASFFMMVSVGIYTDSREEVEFAKAGLQQCLEIQGISVHKVWKKECNK